MARLLECQFIIATHSPFMLGTLNAKIYNIDKKEYDIANWRMSGIFIISLKSMKASCIL